VGANPGLSPEFAAAAAKSAEVKSWPECSGIRNVGEEVEPNGQHIGVNLILGIWRSSWFGKLSVLRAPLR